MIIHTAKITQERLATLLIFLANGFGIGAWAAAVPRVKDKLLLSDTSLGMALFAFALGAIIAMPIAGRLAPRMGSGRATALLATVFVIALSLPAWAPGFIWLCVALLFLGASNGALDVSMNGHASAIETAMQSPIMSSFHAAWSLGTLLGAGAAALIQSHGGGLLAGLAMPSVASAMVVGMAAYLGLREVSLPDVGLDVIGEQKKGHPDSAEESRTPATNFEWANVRLLKLAGLAFLAMLVEGAIADWSAVFLRTTLVGPASQAVIGYAAFAFSMTACRLIGDHFIKRFGPVFTVGVGGVIAAVGLAGCLISPSIVTACVGFVLVGIGLANIIPVIFSTAGKLTAIPASGVAMTATAGYAGFLAGPPLIGFTAGLVGLRIALWIGFAALIVIALFGRKVVGTIGKSV